MASNDRIEKEIVLRAPRQRVWRALTDSTEFGTWFGMKFTAPFKAGVTMKGTIIPTAVDAEVAQMQKQYEGIVFDITVERVEPETFFSFRWHPGAVERGVDYSREPTTLVEFRLEEVGGGILLKVSESGFDKLPASRRAEAFTSNEAGWGLVIHLIEKYLAQGR